MFVACLAQNFGDGQLDVFFQRGSLKMKKQFLRYELKCTHNFFRKNNGYFILSVFTILQSHYSAAHAIRFVSINNTNNNKVQNLIVI
jgi:hypothetical protein